MALAEVSECPLVCSFRLICTFLTTQQSTDQLAIINDLVENILTPPLDESRSYGLLTEVLFMHKNILKDHGLDFQVIPQLRIPWNNDVRHCIPDIGCGRLPRGGGVKLQGGVEAKVATTIMLTFPDLALLLVDEGFRTSLNIASLQASDQVKSAIKSGFLPNTNIEWIAMVGPYFIVYKCGPFSPAELATRGAST